MSRDSFENFGYVAENATDNIVAAGRYLIQRGNEKLIVPEIYQKLDLCPDDNILDIGCGTGNLTIPLAFMVNKVTAVDHKKCLEALRKRFPKSENLIFKPGNFIDLEFENKFDKILCYSVLQYLTNTEEVIKFIKKAASLLGANGILLLGDIPNIDAKKRFTSTSKGKETYKNFIQKIPIDNDQNPGSIKYYLKKRKKDSKCVIFTDKNINAIIKEVRSIGYNIEILEQNHRLPFGNWNKDIKIEKIYSTTKF